MLVEHLRDPKLSKFGKFKILLRLKIKMEKRLMGLNVNIVVRFMLQVQVGVPAI